MDRWLDANAGREFTVNRSSRRVRFTPAAADDAATSAAAGGVEASPCARGPVLARLPDVLLPTLGVSTETVSSINRRITFEQIRGGGGSADEGIRARLLGLKFPSERHRNVAIQVIALLAGGQDDEAAERVQLFAGGAATASQDPGGFAAAVGGSENSDFLVSLSGLSSEDIERRVGGDGLAEWMLFLHPPTEASNGLFLTGDRRLDSGGLTHGRIRPIDAAAGHRPGVAPRPGGAVGPAAERAGPTVFGRGGQAAESAQPVSPLPPPREVGWRCPLQVDR